MRRPLTCRADSSRSVDVRGLRPVNQSAGFCESLSGVRWNDTFNLWSGETGTFYVVVVLDVHDDRYRLARGQAEGVGVRNWVWWVVISHSNYIIRFDSVDAVRTPGSAVGSTYEDCEQPPEIAHATARLTVDDNEEYSTAHYTCKPGYRMQEPQLAELRCNIETDEWETTKLPACVPGHFIGRLDASIGGRLEAGRV
ncbi:AGAP005714-PA-like protein [Anopheles sinensis]|uniref:AGAP005714-PA-like protein n=1 Tax=Anopheles sinensis TaxID=74873 RepID=A0A084WDP3_ANOSI|nr:AGAP005714-PA-like protein [Anopheles sinensis]